MTKILYLDCGYGIAGDMFLAALCGLGVNIDDVHAELKKVIKPEFKLEVEQVNQHGITANHLKLKFDDESLNNFDSGQHQHTHYASIKENIEKSDLGENVKELSLKMFDTVARAESKIHGIPVPEIAFHEVGAVDSLVDIIGGCVALDKLGVDQVISTPVATGFGKVQVAHGLYPVPAPATLEILQGVPLEDFDVRGELTTPTGAAIVKTFSDSFSDSMKGRVLRSSYGAGSKKFDHPNVLRAVLLDKNEQIDDTVDKVCELSCEIDDMSGESLGYFLQEIMNDGALDMYCTPIIMKKNRPAYQVTLLCKPKEAKHFEKRILTETSTFGLRSSLTNRAILTRDFSTIELKEGLLKVKCGYYDNKLVKVTPEFESVRKLAKDNQTTYNNMYEKAIAAINDRFN